MTTLFGDNNPDIAYYWHHSSGGRDSCWGCVVFLDTRTLYKIGCNTYYHAPADEFRKKLIIDKNTYTLSIPTGLSGVVGYSAVNMSRKLFLFNLTLFSHYILHTPYSKEIPRWDFIYADDVYDEVAGDGGILSTAATVLKPTR